VTRDERGVLNIAHGPTDNLGVAFGRHARGDDDRTGDDLRVDACFDLGRV
jgi:hypothetical protein